MKKYKSVTPQRSSKKIKASYQVDPDLPLTDLDAKYIYWDDYEDIIEYVLSKAPIETYSNDFASCEFFFDWFPEIYFTYDGAPTYYVCSLDSYTEVPITSIADMIEEIANGLLQYRFDYTICGDNSISMFDLVYEDYDAQEGFFGEWNDEHGKELSEEELDDFAKRCLYDLANWAVNQGHTLLDWVENNRDNINTLNI